MLEQGAAGTYRPVERGAHTGAGFLVGLVDPHWNRLFLKDGTLWKSESHWRSLQRTVSVCLSDTGAEEGLLPEQWQKQHVLN